MLIPSLVIWENRNYLKKSAYLFLILILFICSFPFIKDPMKNLADTEICYTGYNTNDYVSPKWIESKAKEILISNTYVFNEMSPYHVNKADVEYLLQRLAFYKNLRMVFDPKRIKKADSSFKEIWVVAEKCANSERLKNTNEFWKSENFYLENPKIIESDLGCIQIYKRE